MKKPLLMRLCFPSWGKCDYRIALEASVGGVRPSDDLVAVEVTMSRRVTSKDSSHVKSYL